MRDESVRILENRKVNGKYYKLVFKSPALARGVKPGQFLNLQIQPGLDPFLRRPFSYYRVLGERIEILYEVLGRGTALLAEKKKGDTLQAMGPLGKSFREKIQRTKKRVLIAGGVGLPPLIFLAERLPTDYVLIGTKGRAEVMPKKELAQVRGEILYSTNDGSYGAKGYVTVLLKGLLRKHAAGELFIQTCGPTPMMQAVMDMAREKKIQGEASLDKPMACGVGSCLGCMVKTPQGWVPSCTQGPVFSFERVEYKA